MPEDEEKKEDNDFEEVEIDKTGEGAREGEEKDDYEDEEEVEQQLEDDEISPREAGFQEGYDRAQ